MIQRPCDCNKVNECHLCWLAVNDRRYRILWGIEAKHIFSKNSECRHRGSSTGETIGCASCSGNVQIKLFSCDKHGSCTLAKQVDSVRSCNTCQDHQTFDYQAATEVLDFTNIFQAPERAHNCSILRYKHQIVFVQRLGWDNCSLRIGFLNEDLTPISWTTLGGGTTWIEDPRLFIYQNRLHVSVTRVKIDSKGFDRVTINYMRLHDDLTLDKLFEVHLEDRTQVMEKNWGFFEQNGKLLAVHTINPHHIIQVMGEYARFVHCEPHELSFPENMLHRGGAAPHYDEASGEYYCFYHTVDHAKAINKPCNREYGLGVYTFTKDFVPRRCTLAPIFLPIEIHRPEPHIPLVVFPGGVISQGSDWLVACGYFDSYSWLLRIPKATVEASLKPLGVYKNDSDTKPVPASLLRKEAL